MANALLMKEVYPLTNDKTTNDKKSVRFHGHCYTLWNGERRALNS